MEDYKEFTGKDIDEVIQEACAHFGVDRGKLEIEIQDNGKAGIFGLVGAKKAVIHVRLVDNSADLKRIVGQVVERLTSSIVERPFLDIAVEGDRVKVSIRSSEEANLLIGREGATLAAVEYLANRIIAKRWREPVHIQIDAGGYRLRQDEDLRELALQLAEKVRSQGKPQSTKPLSAYHRRVVHLALQEDRSVVTRSKGDGPMKRVLILPKREAPPQQEGD